MDVVPKCPRRSRPVKSAEIETSERALIIVLVDGPLVPVNAAGEGPTASGVAATCMISNPDKLRASRP